MALASVAACRRTPPPEPPPPRPPQIEGHLALSGLRAGVTVIRDRWGIPHISAGNTDDLFFAQGFVQAQDRLFQMDLWRRAAQGRLSETLGANFIERDAMTRRVQFRGDIEREWASYGPDTRQIASAFTRGINAWVAIARADLPEEFVLAGWQPEFWKPEDLLNRTDAFLASANAQDDLLRARLSAAIGTEAVGRLLPVDNDMPLVAPSGVDFSAITFVVPDTLRRVGTPPFFSALAAPVTQARRPGSNAWAIASTRSATGAPLLAVDPHRMFDAPALRYLVHLTAPGWNVAGATSPWMPGVAIGHNDRIAWGMTSAAIDTQDIFVERINPDDPHQVESGGRWIDMAIDLERLDVKGRATPFEYERLYTSHGVIVGLDRQRHLAYTLRWSGTEPGGASELAALAVDRATSWTDFQAALSRWRMPTAEFVYADAGGRIGRRVVGLTPLRRGGGGALPAPGWTGAYDWQGWRDGSGDSTEADPASGLLVSANDSIARRSRIVEVLTRSTTHTADLMRQLQLDTTAWNASQLLPLVERLTGLGEPASGVRQRLLAWDRRVEPTSDAAALYIAFEQALARLLAEQRVPREFVEDVASRIDVAQVLTRPTAAWFDRDPTRARNDLLVEALGAAAAAQDRTLPRDVTFTHALAAFEDARRRFNVGPFPLPGYGETVFSTTDRTGPSFRAVFDVANWDRSMVTNAPGQSGSPASAHYDDLAARWAAGEYTPLPFSEAAVTAAATSMLTLEPR